MSRGANEFAHSPETDQRIRDGYAASEPVQAIATALGVSKNTIIGRARVLGLAGTYDREIVRKRIGDAHRGSKHSYGPRPNTRLWWANRPPEERAAHFAKMWAARDAAAIRKREG